MTAARTAPGAVAGLDVCGRGRPFPHTTVELRAQARRQRHGPGEIGRATISETILLADFFPDGLAL